MNVGPPYCRAEMYAGRVTCCPLVSRVLYATAATKKKNVAPKLVFSRPHVRDSPTDAISDCLKVERVRRRFVLMSSFLVAAAAYSW